MSYTARLVGVYGLSSGTNILFTDPDSNPTVIPTDNLSLSYNKWNLAYCKFGSTISMVWKVIDVNGNPIINANVCLKSVLNGTFWNNYDANGITDYYGYVVFTITNSNINNAGSASSSIAGIKITIADNMVWSRMALYVNFTSKTDLIDFVISSTAGKVSYYLIGDTFQKLYNVNLTGANLSGANLTGANLIGTNLTDANLTGIISGKITGTPTLGYNWKLISGYLVGPSANLTGANLIGANLTGANLTDANLTGATLTNAILTNAILTGVKSGGITGPVTLDIVWKLINGYLVGPGANLTDANLTGMNLSGANLTGSILTGSNLTGIYLIHTDLTGATLTNAILTNADLTGVISGGITGPVTLPNNWKLINGYLVGPDSNLTGAILTGANLTGAHLTGSNLTGADLTGVISGGITGPITLDLNWKLISGYLVGPGANLTGADLNGADLTGTDLTGSNLTNAILTGVTSEGITGTPASLPSGWSLTDGVLVPPSSVIKDLISQTDVSLAVVTYSMLYSNAVFTNDGTNWYVEYTESSIIKKDTLIGVKKVAFSDKKVYLYGAGSGCINIFNTSTTACVSDASSCGYLDGDVVLYAGGAVYDSILDSGYIINKSITIKSIPSNGSTVNATLKNKAGITISRNYEITSDNVTIENIILDYNSNAKSTDSFMKIYGSGSLLRQIENITLKNVRCINLNVLRGFDINFAAKILIEGCYQQGMIERDGIGLSSVSRCDIKSSTILRGSNPGHGSIGMYATALANIKNGSEYSQGKNYTKTSGVFNEPILESVHDGTKIKDYFNMCRYITIEDNTFEDYKIYTQVVYKPRIFVQLSIPQDNTIVQPFQYSFTNPSGSIISYTQDVNYFSTSTLSESLYITLAFFQGQPITVRDSNNLLKYPFGFGSISISKSNSDLYVGNTLSVSNTTNLSGYAWTSGPTYTWYKGTDILGTGSTYTVQPRDAGYSIHVVMTGTDSSSDTLIPLVLGGNGSRKYGPVSQTSPAVGPFSLITLGQLEDGTIVKSGTTVPFVISNDIFDIIIDVNVKNIPNNYFQEAALKTITFNSPSHLERIGDYAFYGCTLTSVTLPSSLISIGSHAFQSCALTSVIIPNSVTSIGEFAFYNCIALESVTLPNSLTSIENLMFWNCTSLKTINIPSSLISIGTNAFQQCTSLPPITLPSSLISIGGFAFNTCTSLTSITLPDLLTSIGGQAFGGSGLTSITLPDSLTSSSAIIGDGVFQSCTHLTSVTLPDSLKSITSNMFYRCTSLTSITLPSQLLSIESSAFWMCTSLTGVTLPNSLSSIKDSAFANCALTSITIPNEVTSIDEFTFYECPLTSVTLPSSLLIIGESAFEGCLLTSVDLPSSLTSIAVNAFKKESGRTIGYYVNIETTYNTDTGLDFLEPFSLIVPVIQSFAIPSKIVGDSAFPLSVTSTSTGSFIYSSPSNAVSISGNTVTIVSDGEVTITATLAAHGNYSSGSVTATFKIYKAPSVITRDELKTLLESSPNDLQLYNGKTIIDSGNDYIVLVPTTGNNTVDLTPIKKGDNFMILNNVKVNVGNCEIESNPSTQSLTITSAGVVETVNHPNKSKSYRIKNDVNGDVYVTFRYGSIIAESAPSAGSSGDPYVTTFSGHKYKLPNILRTYRLIEHDNVIINATVSELTDSEKEEMKQLGLKEGTENMFNGYFYESFYITNGKSSILFDRHLNIIENDGYEITEGKGKFNCPIEGKSDYTSKTITVDDVEIKLMKYRNPQILNGIDVTIGDPSNSKGILNSIYNPKNSMVKSIKSVKPLKDVKGVIYNYKQKELWVKKRVHL